MNTVPHDFPDDSEKERFDPMADDVEETPEVGPHGIRDQSWDAEHADPNGFNIDPETGEVKDAVTGERRPHLDSGPDPFKGEDPRD